MKKVLFIIIAFTLLVANVNAKDLTKGQMELRLNIVKSLAAKRLQPKVDTDGDVFFVKDGSKFYAIVNENWTSPYMVTLYKEYSYDEVYTERAIKNCIAEAGRFKAVKLYAYSKSYAYRIDVVCQNANVFTNTLDVLIGQINAAEKRVENILVAMPEIDINNKEAIYNKSLAYYDKGDTDKSFILFEMLANEGYEQAYGYMGLSYQYGYGVAKDENSMIEYYNLGIEAGYPVCAYRLASYYYLKGKYEQAFANFMKCASNENNLKSDAWYWVGTMQEKGQGTDKDVTKAVASYKKSVKYATELECDARLALMRLGETVEDKSDFVDASKTMLMGMSVSDMYKTGEEYEYGFNNRYVSLPKAYAYYKAAADNGYLKAFTKMGDIYVGKYYPFNNKSQSDKYYAKAFKQYKQKIDSDGDACYMIGYMYQYGNGVEKDIEQAKFYYKSGALKGSADASWHYGLVCKDDMEYADAYKYFKLAAEKGQGMAMFELAKLYEDGLGVTQSKKSAIEWYEKCSKSQYKARTDALKALKRLNVN